MAKSFRSPAEFAKHYKIDSTGSYAERAAKFLNDAANELPYRFFDKRTVAKIALGLSRTPDEKSDAMDRLSSVLNSANKLLAREHGREVWIDPVEGVRATVNDSDLARTKHRKKRRRVKHAVQSLEYTDKLIDVNKVDDTLKKELQRSRRALRALSEAVADMPQLPSAKGKSEPQSED